MKESYYIYMDRKKKWYHKVEYITKELVFIYVLIELGVVAFWREALGKPFRVSAVIVNHVVVLCPFEPVLTC